jgi:hypothetical protein
MKAPPFVLGEYRMNKVVLVLAADRMASGAAIGGGAGLVAGGVGVIPGALVGAAIGGLTSPDQVNLGEPVWDDDDGDEDSQ